ncbi:phosphoribosylamine--glycine ligase [Virgibacillus phasianinus]|uniref:Phosphoribosylamine--glycine ligase n=1 Tax=Virgibacillus phasianinus TaxID=2017483 RepID=A0A220TYV2_9BACI|nr:phosphoribosylamine--glycine ligase [Virgibacillus phasianinus]ASK61174.1 phosphoribosylamine--glycine ligase [Virgibacillus phasianinus]
MNVLVIGKGGREHSILLKLAESADIKNLYAAPGNGGIAQHATCVAINETEIDQLVDFAKRNQIDLTVVGPEKPLLDGIANRFQDEGLKVFAPTKEAALLEGSKSFAKEFMQKYAIPTAGYATFTDPEEAKSHIKENGAPIVIKADGLAAGKGVVVAETVEEALEAVDNMLVNKAFAEAGETIVVEECLVGKEFSLMAFVNEGNVYPMVPARDHKRAYDNDQGPNTGGMGAFAPVEDITPEIIAYTTREVLQKTADGMVEEGRPFTGILYAGLMQTEDGPKVIEFNTRFGDPETQVVLPLLQNDLLQVFLDVLDGKDPQLKWDDQVALGVVVASVGYPGSYEKGVQLPEIPREGNAYVVHAGTKKVADGIVSDGGRVLLVGAKETNMNEAAKTVYQTLKSLDDTDGFFYRKDIGKH